jgi:hypothetical protein
MKGGKQVKNLDITQKLTVNLDVALKKSYHELPCDDDPCCCWKRRARKVLNEAIAYERKRRAKK